MKGLLRAAVDELLDRLLGEVQLPEAELQPNQSYLMRRSVVVGGGVLLKGTEVEFTGVRDKKDAVEIKVIDIPDYQWESGRLPYGPGFVLFVPADTLDPK